MHTENLSAWKHDHVFDGPSQSAERGTRAVMWITAMMMLAEIIDGQTVITGSFNFTKAAEEKNAENVVVMRGNPELARLYEKNWVEHWEHSEGYTR